MEGEDVQYRHKFKKNWSDMKDVLSTQWRKLLDKCLENGIVDFEDIERIQSELHDSDTVQLLLLKVIRLKKFEVFLTIMDTMCIEFKQLADRVRETVVDTQSGEVNGSLNRESDIPISTARHVVDEVLQGFSERLLENGEQLRQYIDEKVETVVTDKKNLVELYTKCLELKDQYIVLQNSYANARVKINELTILAQQKHFENSKLLQEIKHLKQKIVDLEEIEYQVENIESNNVLINNQREQLVQLETAYIDKERELSSLRDGIEKQTTTIKDKERELQNAKDSIEQLKQEKVNLQSQHAHQAADKANDIMKRLELLLRDIEIGGSGVVMGRACPTNVKQRIRR